MNKLIRNIPDDVAEVLQEQAKAKGLTLEAYIRLILIETAKKLSDRDKKQGGENGKEG
jgi:plasmid stability protein